MENKTEDIKKEKENIETPESLDDLINEVEQPKKDNKSNDETEKINFSKDDIIAMGAGIIKNSYAKAGLEKEGIAKADIYETINGIVLSVIPFEKGLENIKSVEMKPQTALMIGGASLVISALILSAPALKEIKKQKQKPKKIEKGKDKENKEDDKNG